ncbi:MAG: signal peptidase I [Pseudomonadota bacterium]
MSSNTDVDKAKRSDSGWKETLRIFIHALILALLVRVFLYQPFNIPSGSMKPTLLVGDYLFVSKLSYGYSRYSFPFGFDLFSGRIFASKPKPGDVIVFKYPRDNSTDYIKRLIAVPGDRVAMKSGVLYINGEAVKKRSLGMFKTVREGRPITIPMYEEELPNGVKYRVLDERPDHHLDDVDEITVRAGHYFLMGDNRDNSTDSRAKWDVGEVPFQNLVGRADIIFFSAATDDPSIFSVSRPWTWPGGIRWGRFFDLVR